MSSVYDFTVQNAKGENVSLSEYKYAEETPRLFIDYCFRGKVLIIANVASGCGLTNKNYTQFKELLDV